MKEKEVSFSGMAEFQFFCKSKFVDWFNEHRDEKILMFDTYVVWCCKALQNYKCLVSQDIEGDTTYAEYTYNGDKKELYCDYYVKEENVVIK